MKSKNAVSIKRVRLEFEKMIELLNLLEAVKQALGVTRNDAAVRKATQLREERDHWKQKYLDLAKQTTGIQHLGYIRKRLKRDQTA